MYQYEKTAAEYKKLKLGVLEDPHKTLKYWSQIGNGRNDCKVLAFFHFRKSLAKFCAHISLQKFYFK